MLCVGSLSAQDFLFKVMASKGSNKVEKSTATTGQKVFKGQKIQVATGGYMSLVHNTGKTVELKKAGTYDASTLATKYAKKSDGFASRYSNFVLAGMDNSGTTGNANVTGAVHRAALVEPDESENIKLYTTHIQGVDGNYMLRSNPGVVKWDAKEGGESKDYVLEVRGFENEIILTKDVVGKNQVEVDFSTIPAKDDGFFIIVRGKDNEKALSNRAFVRIISEEDAKEAQEELDKIKGELDLEAAIDNLVLARYYEEKKMFINAVAAYEKAMELAPGVESYQKVYDDYLYRLGVKDLKTEADSEEE